MKKAKSKKPTRVKCDNCKRSFQIKLKRKEVAEGVTRVYFRCPRCERRYTAYFEDKNFKEKSRRVRELRDEIAGLIDRQHETGENYEEEIDRLVQERTSIQIELRGRQDRLREVYGS